MFYLRNRKIFSLSQIFPRIFCHVSFRSLQNTDFLLSLVGSSNMMFYVDSWSCLSPRHLGLNHWPAASIICHNVEQRHSHTAWLGPQWELSVGTATTSQSTQRHLVATSAGTLTWPAAQHNYAKNAGLYECPGSLRLSQLISQDVPSPPSPPLTSSASRTSVGTYGVSSSSNVTI